MLRSMVVDAVLREDKIMTPGEWRIGYDASALYSGAYLLVLRTPGMSAALRLLVIK